MAGNSLGDSLASSEEAMLSLEYIEYQFGMYTSAIDNSSRTFEEIYRDFSKIKYSFLEVLESAIETIGSGITYWSEIKEQEKCRGTVLATMISIAEKYKNMGDELISVIETLESELDDARTNKDHRPCDSNRDNAMTYR